MSQLPKKIEDLLIEQGYDVYHTDRSIVTGCPDCGRKKRLYIFKSNGRGECQACKQIYWPSELVVKLTGCTWQDAKAYFKIEKPIEAGKKLIPFIEEEYSAASSDMGDVSQTLPSIMLGLPGVNGLFHNPGFRVTDEKAAYVLPSVVLARYLEKLVADTDS